MGQPRVLVVDDDPSMLMILEFQLNKLGASVKTTASETAALEYLSHTRPDLVLTDFNLSEGFASALLSHVVTRGIRVCVVSGVDPDLRFLGQSAPTVTKVKKPVSLETLEQLIRGNYESQ